MRNSLTYLLFIFLILFSCGNNLVNNDFNIGGFDISPKDDIIIYSCTVGERSILYQLDMDTKKTNVLFSPEENNSFKNPKFSKDGKEIVFIEYDRYNSTKRSTLCLANSDGTNFRRVFNYDGIITEVIFSNTKDKLLFCKAKVFDNYSPLARKMPHDFDIYELDLNTKEEEQLTDLNAYSIYNISEVDTSYILFRMVGDKSGMFVCSQKYPEEIKRFSPLNNPRGDESLYSTPIYSSEHKIVAFTAPYQLYTMDLEKRDATLLDTGDQYRHFKNILFFNNSNKILFRREREMKFYSINIDGTELTLIGEVNPNIDMK